MYSVARGTSSLSVQVVALYEDGVVTQATHPHIAFTFTFELDALTNVQPVSRKEQAVNTRPNFA